MNTAHLMLEGYLRQSDVITPPPSWGRLCPGDGHVERVARESAEYRAGVRPREQAFENPESRTSRNLIWPRARYWATTDLPEDFDDHR